MENVFVALIAATPPTLAALLSWRHAKATSLSVGHSNGTGTVSKRLDEMLEWQVRHEVQHVRQDARHRASDSWAASPSDTPPAP